MKNMKTNLLTSVFCLLLATASAQSWLTKGLVAYYPFNGNANDESGNGNHGVANNMSFALDRFGNVGRSGLFAGNSTSNVKINGGNLNLQPDFTLSVWINYMAGGTEGPRIFSTAGYEIGTDSTSSMLRHVYFNNTYSNFDNSTIYSSNEFPASNWTHIVAVRAFP